MQCNKKVVPRSQDANDCPKKEASTKTHDPPKIYSTYISPTLLIK